MDKIKALEYEIAMVKCRIKTYTDAERYCRLEGNNYTMARDFQIGISNQRQKLTELKRQLEALQIEQN